VATDKALKTDLTGDTEQEIDHSITVLLVNRLANVSRRLRHLQDKQLSNSYNNVRTMLQTAEFTKVAVSVSEP